MRTSISALLLFLAISSAAPAAESAEPKLSWVDIGGQELALEAFHGRIVVLNFWATWCAPCRKEMPDLIRVQNRYGMYGVQVVGVSADPVDSAQVVADFARDMKINFPVLLGATTAEMQELGLGTTLPATAVIDREGHVIEWITGIVHREELEETIEGLLNDGHAERLDAPAKTKKRGRTRRIASARPHRHRHGAGTQASLVPS